MRILVLGGGLVGQAIVRDLAMESSFDITCGDLNESALRKIKQDIDVKTVVADLACPGTTKKLCEGQDIVVGAVPGWLGMSVLREAIEVGCKIVDISFMPEDPYELDESAREKGVPVIVDSGVAPGLSNLLIGNATSTLDEVDDVRILVGGLPVVRYLPYEYGAVFSPVDVLEEYTRPAYYVENGKEIVRPALSEHELIDVPGVGTLEAFLTDGLRTLRRTINSKNMKEKTLRYPGHCERIRLLSETGFLSDQPLDINGTKIKPIEVSAKLLEKMWKLEPGEEDITVLHVEVSGKKDGKDFQHVYDMVDLYDTGKKVTSMARTTGYSATAMVNLLASGKVKERGVLPLERIGVHEELFNDFLNYLKERNIEVQKNVTSPSR